MFQGGGEGSEIKTATMAPRITVFDWTLLQRA